MVQEAEGIKGLDKTYVFSLFRKSKYLGQPSDRRVLGGYRRVTRINLRYVPNWPGRARPEKEGEVDVGGVKGERMRRGRYD